MATHKHIVTTSPDGAVILSSLSSGRVSVTLKAPDNEAANTANENDLIAAVLEYAHERGLRRTRKAPKASGAAKVRKPRQPKPVVVSAEPDQAELPQ